VSGLASFPRLKQWLAHHTSSFISAIVDFGTMVIAVEVGKASPVVGTVIGAALGATTNFLLGRNWTYRRTQRAGAKAIPMQMVRYLLVALASLGLNASGEHLFANVLHVQYVLARVITAVIVSNAWNYPMQRFFVFGDKKVAT
jgi:putative flippase GtrA